MSVQNVLVTLLPDPDDYTSPEDKRWQEECEKLYLAIKKKIPQASIRPTKRKGSEDTRAAADIFSILSVALASIGGFKTLYELLKLWVENRNQNRERVSVTIKIGDSELNISNISIEKAIDLCERYLGEGQTQVTS
ncbi:MAG: hypothetical protein BBJ57_13795 [Desulfobacterales bacterium PC51MH44]|nr:MAG: hypothetical protein BBJ57_13795 [Desulfobacterales bacterium PC51MH44]